jgi:H+/Cl- antiporter ClcA
MKIIWYTLLILGILTFCYGIYASDVMLRTNQWNDFVWMALLIGGIIGVFGFIKLSSKPKSKDDGIKEDEK